MISSNLEKTLSILKIGRVNLIEDILLKRRHDILRVAFKYESDLRVLATIFEQYFIEWINKQIVASFNESPILGIQIVSLFSAMLEDRLNIRREDLINIDRMLPDLFESKIDALKSFVTVEDVIETRLNEKKFIIEKDNALFKRLLNKMEEERNGST